MRQSRSVVSRRPDLPGEFLVKAADYIDWQEYTATHDIGAIPEIVFEKMPNRLDWTYICQKYKNLSESFLRKYADHLDWKWVSASQQLSLDFIRDFTDKLDWFYVSRIKLPEAFFREYVDWVNWSGVMSNSAVSEEFIRDFCDRFPDKNSASIWDGISLRPNLSEEFMREFQDKLNWHTLSLRQKFSAGFMEEFADKLDWSVLLRRYSKDELELLPKDLLQKVVKITERKLSDKQQGSGEEAEEDLLITFYRRIEEVDMQEKAAQACTNSNLTIKKKSNGCGSMGYYVDDDGNAVHVGPARFVTVYSTETWVNPDELVDLLMTFPKEVVGSVVVVPDVMNISDLSD